MNTKMKFKLLLTLSVLIMTAGSSLMAQNSDPSPSARFGVKGGLNVSNLFINDVNDENARFGFNGGVYGQILSSEAFAIQPELLFSTKGAQADYGGIVNSTVKFNLNYLDLPVLAVIKLGPSAEIHAGVYGSYLLGANINYSGNVGNGNETINRDNLKSYDWGWSGGLGLNFGAVQVGARYNYGMVKIADSNSAKQILGNSRNSLAQLYIAFNFNQN